MKFSHCPVLYEEVLHLLQPSLAKTFLDLTFGAGNHSKHLCENKAGKIVAFDRDPLSYNYFNELNLIHNNITFYNTEFSFINSVLPNQMYDGIIMDLGASSMQMDDDSRGFALSKDGDLNMRMDANKNSITAYDVVNYGTEHEIAEILDKYGDEHNCELIAKNIVNARQIKPIATTYDLKTIVQNAFLKYNPDLRKFKQALRKDKLGRLTHVATKTFQALRIFVNDELNQLNITIPKLQNYLKPPQSNQNTQYRPMKSLPYSFYENKSKPNIIPPNPLTYSKQFSLSGGLEASNPPLLIIITFHSLEEKIVKRHFETPHSGWTLYNKHVIVPTGAEIHANPRSRSAKLLAAYKSIPF